MPQSAFCFKAATEMKQKSPAVFAPAHLQLQDVFYFIFSGHRGVSKGFVSWFLNSPLVHNKSPDVHFSIKIHTITAFLNFKSYS